MASIDLLIIDCVDHCSKFALKGILIQSDRGHGVGHVSFRKVRNNGLIVGIFSNIIGNIVIDFRAVAQLLITTDVTLGILLAADCRFCSAGFLVSQIIYISFNSKPE